MKQSRHVTTVKDHKKKHRSGLFHQIEEVLPQRCQSDVIEDDACSILRELPRELVDLIRKCVVRTFIDCRDMVRFHATCKRFFSLYNNLKVDDVALICDVARRRNDALYRVSPKARYCINVSIISSMEKRRRILAAWLKELRLCDAAGYALFTSFRASARAL
jgi:hypothetical protein